MAATELDSVEPSLGKAFNVGSGLWHEPEKGSEVDAVLVVLRGGAMRRTGSMVASVVGKRCGELVAGNSNLSVEPSSCTCASCVSIAIESEARPGKPGNGF